MLYLRRWNRNTFRNPTIMEKNSETMPANSKPDENSEAMPAFKPNENSETMFANFKPDENSEAMFANLCEQMIRLGKEKTDAGIAEATGIANRLITFAECPLLFRARAHQYLACGDDNYVWHAREAVRIVKLGISKYGSGEGEQKLLSQVQEQLRRAERDWKKLQELEAADATDAAAGIARDDDDVETEYYGGEEEVDEAKGTN